jgi:hypothetical protein
MAPEPQPGGRPTGGHNVPAAMLEALDLAPAAS